MAPALPILTCHTLIPGSVTASSPVMLLVQVWVRDCVQPQRLPHKLRVRSLVRHAFCIVCREDAALPVGQHPAVVEGALRAAAHLNGSAGPEDHKEGREAERSWRH